MDAHVLALVLLGALLHAVWNAVARASRGRGADAVQIAVGAGVLALPGIVLLPAPAVLHERLGRLRWLGVACTAVGLAAVKAA